MAMGVKVSAFILNSIFTPCHALREVWRSMKLRLYHAQYPDDVQLAIMCPRRESNPHLRFRKPPFYPLNYGDEIAIAARGKAAEILCDGKSERQVVSVLRGYTNVMNRFAPRKARYADPYNF